MDSLLIGDLGDVRMATRDGLSRFNLAADSIYVFDGEDGLQGRWFYRGAAWKDKEGLTYFGGAIGVNKVDPELLEKAEPVSRPVLLGFKLGCV